MPLAPVTVANATHSALLDPVTGTGVLVLPRAEGDLRIGGSTLNAAGWHDMLQRLSAIGWTLLADEDDLPMVLGSTVQGASVIALYGLEPVITEPSAEEISAAEASLLAMVGAA